MKSHRRVWKSYTCQDKFTGFFILKLLFLEHPCAQAALELTASRAHLQQKVPAPLSDTAAGRDRPLSHETPRAVMQFHHPSGWTLSQHRPAPALCRTRSRSSSRVTKCIAALRCWFYRSQSSRRLSQKVQSKNQSAKWIWLRCSQTMALLPCLRNTQGACITLLGSEATAQLICNYGTSWWPKAPWCVIWAFCLWQKKKKPMPTVSQLPLTLKRQSYMEEINWARI